MRLLLGLFRCVLRLVRDSDRRVSKSNGDRRRSGEMMAQPVTPWHTLAEADTYRHN